MALGDTSIGARISAARAYAGLSAAEFAGIMGYSPTQVSRYENGHQEPNEAFVRRVAVECGVPLAFLLHGFAGEGNDASVDSHLERRVKGLEEAVHRLLSAESTNASASRTDPRRGASEANQQRHRDETSGSGLSVLGEEIIGVIEDGFDKLRRPADPPSQAEGPAGDHQDEDAA